MFDTMLESTGVRPSARSTWTLPVSMAAHLVVLATVVAISWMAVEVIQDRVPPIVFTATAIGTPPPPPPPLGGAPSSAVAESVPRPIDPEPTVLPPEIAPNLEPEARPNLEAPGVGVPGGVPWGMEGGVDGGVIGGVPDGESDGPLDGPTGGVVSGPLGPIVPTPDVTLPVKQIEVKPEFPQIARLLRRSGKVVCTAVIDTAGNVVDVKVIQSPHASFDAPTIEAVRQWKYTPAILDGVPVSVYMTVIVDFELD